MIIPMDVLRVWEVRRFCGLVPRRSIWESCPEKEERVNDEKELGQHDSSISDEQQSETHESMIK